MLAFRDSLSLSFVLALSVVTLSLSAHGSEPESEAEVTSPAEEPSTGSPEAVSDEVADTASDGNESEQSEESAPEESSKELAEATEDDDKRGNEGQTSSSGEEGSTIVDMSAAKVEREGEAEEPQENGASKELPSSSELPASQQDTSTVSTAQEQGTESKETQTAPRAESNDNTAPAESFVPLSEAWPSLPKSGFRGWGLGIDVPMTGVLTGNATSSSHGIGYTLGFGLGYEVVRGWVIRLALTGGETSRGEATIQYLDGGIPLTRSFEAEWLGVELGLGVQRIFKDFDPLIWPYIGLEAGPVFAGYYYRFDSAAVSTLATNDETTRYGANEYEAVGLGWAGKLSGGLRIELMPGIEWGTEYSLSLTTVSELEPVTNTRQIREVFPIQEWIFQHRLIIGLWLGL